jgi:polygalacturonase
MPWRGVGLWQLAAPEGAAVAASDDFGKGEAGHGVGPARLEQAGRQQPRSGGGTLLLPDGVHVAGVLMCRLVLRCKAFTLGPDFTKLDGAHAL